MPPDWSMILILSTPDGGPGSCSLLLQSSYNFPHLLAFSPPLSSSLFYIITHLNRYTEEQTPSANHGDLELR